MKKTLSIILTVVIALSAFVATAYAADTKTEALLDEIISSKSYYVDLGDVLYEEEGSPFRDVKGYAKLYEYENGRRDIKLAATAKLWFFNVKFLLSEGELYVYLPLISINLNDFSGEDTDLSFLADEFAKLFDALESDFLDCMKLRSAGEKDTEEYGLVYVEEFVPDIRKVIDYADKKGLIEIPEDSVLASMNEDDVIAWLNAQGEKGKNVLRMFEPNASFYYKGDDLIAFDITLYDAADDNAVLSSEDLMIKKAVSIGSNVEDNIFDKPAVLFDITSLLTMIFGSHAD